MRFGLTLSAVALLAIAVSPARADSPRAAHPEVRALIERVTLAYGGREALERVKAYRAEGLLLSAMRHSESPTVRIFARPDRFKVLIDYEGGAEARWVDGPHGWRNEAGKALEPAKGPMVAAMLLQAARMNVPWILYERSGMAELTDSLTEDGVRCAGVQVPLAEGMVLRAWVHPGSFMIVRSQGLMSHGGMSTHFETSYSDFRDVHGVKFAFREENFASGVQTAVTTLRSVTLNPPLRPDEFAPPGAPPEKPRKGEL